ncbi:MAG: hypothetical protein ABSF70_04455 [Terracidiphilus sp.]|jgi:hypothetical protein
MISAEENVALKTISYIPGAGLFAEAERELSAFLSAVIAVHGPQCVMKAAKHWIEALDDVCPSASASRECFRKVSVAAAVSLKTTTAARIC